MQAAWIGQMAVVGAALPKICAILIRPTRAKRNYYTLNLMKMMSSSWMT